MINDYIRREDALKGQKTGTFANGICFEAKRCVPVDYIESLKPADVAPVVHGRWIWKPTKQYCPPDCWYPPLSCNEETWDEKNGTWLEDEMYCSECDYHNYHEIKYNFCPNCGAIMDREE